MSGVSFLVNFGLTVALVPLLVGKWGADTYGKWLALNAVYNIIIILDIGHQSYVGNEIALKWAGSPQEAREVAGSGLRMGLFFGGAQVVVAAVLGVLGRFSLLPGTWGQILAQPILAGALVVLTAAWMASGTLGGILVRFHSPIGRFARGQVWAIVARVLSTGALLAVALSGGGILAAALATGAVMLVSTAAMLWDLRHLVPEIFPWWGVGDWRQGSRRALRSVLVSGGSVLDQLASNGLLILSVALLGAAGSAGLSAQRTLANTALQGVGFVLNPLQADLARYHAQRETAKLASVFSTYWFLTGAPTVIGFLAVTPVVPRIFELWTRGALHFDGALYGFLALSVVLRSVGAPLVNCLAAINAVRAQLWISGARGGIALAVGFLASRQLGPAGFGLGLALAELVASIALATAAVRALLASEFPWRDLQVALGQVAIAVATFVACLLLPGLQWFVIAAGALAIVVVALLQWRNLSPNARARLTSRLPRWAIKLLPANLVATAT